MALNLKKDENASEANKPEEAKKLKFDLSKKEISTSASESEISADTEQRGGGNKWGFLLILVVVIGGAIWYFTKTDKVASDTAADTNVKTALDTTSIVSEEANSQANASDTVAVSNNPTPSSNNNSSNISSENNTPVASTVTNAPIANFVSGSSSQSSVDNSVLAQIQNKIKNNPNAQILLEGYASSEGDLDYNISLSQERANSLKAYLVSKGVPEKNIIARGMGIQNPIASNDTEAGRRKNRRVEVK
jgi:outer membrane protein OmpA-like peptidoglycan-associated protein